MKYLTLLTIIFLFTQCIIREPGELQIHNFKIVNELNKTVTIDFFARGSTGGFAEPIKFIEVELTSNSEWDTTISANITDGIFAIDDGDSAVITFEDNKKLTYYDNDNFVVKNLMERETYLDEGYPVKDEDGNNVSQYTFTITEAEYMMAE